MWLGMMAAIPNVVRRGGVYHFRRAVPLDLRRTLSRRELTRSLETSSSRIAQLRSRTLYFASEHLFREVRVSIMLSDDQLARLVQDFYATVLDQHNAGRLKGIPMSEEGRKWLAAHYGGVAERSRLALARNELHTATSTTQFMLAKQALKGNLDPTELAQARQAILRAGIDIGEALKARYEGDFNHEPRDKLLKREIAIHFDQPASSPPENASGIALATSETLARDLFSKVSKGFCEDQIASHVWERQTALQATKTYSLLIDICGDRPVASYTRLDAAKFRTFMQKLPADYGKAARYRGLRVEEILASERAERSTPAGPRLTPRTVKRHFSALSALWEVACSGSDASQNIWSGFKFSRGKRPNQQRQMWTLPQLKQLFATPVWMGCASPHRRSRPGEKMIRDEKFWLPLIAVFSAMREEEGCQLRVEDIRCEEGIWFFDISAAPPRKVKNENAVRRVPIHRELIRLGFLEYISALRATNEARVFPNLRPGGADGRLGHGFTKWFTRYRQEVDLYTPGLDFHSFRHTATTLLHQAGVEDSLIDRLTGHATPGETARYTKGSDLAQLGQAINKIDLGEVLPAVKDSRGQQA
jgi:integrase